MISTIRDLTEPNSDFEWGHQRVHNAINDELERTGKVAAPAVLTGDMDDDWHLRHWTAHLSWRQQLNITGSPAFPADRPESFDDWYPAHADEHDVIASALGLS